MPPVPPAKRSGRLRLSRWLQPPSLALWTVLVAATVEVVVLSWAQWQNYLDFIPRQGDLGNYNQSMYTSVHLEGFFYYTTNIPGGTNGSIFAAHFSPTLLALVPIYALWQSPVALIVLKQAALAFACVPLFGLARVYFRSDWLAATFAFLYLLSPFTTTTDWNNFDPETLLPITLISALFFFARGRFWPFIACWALALGTIEAAPPLLFLFAVGGLVGTYLAPSSGPYWTSAQQRKPLLIALLISVVWVGFAALELFVVGPRGGAFGSGYATRYSVLGATSLPDVIPQALLHPGHAGAALNYQLTAKLVFLFMMLAGAGVLWVLGGLRYLLAFGGYFGLALLSNASNFYALGSEYPALIFGFLFAGLVEGTVLLTDFLRGERPEHRHLALKSQLTIQTREIALWLSGQSPGDPAGTEFGRDLEATVQALRDDRLELAESRLLRLRRRIEAAGRCVPVENEPLSAPSSAEAPAVISIPTRPSLASRSRSAIPFVPVIVAVVCILCACALSNPLAQSPLGGEASQNWGVAQLNQSAQILQSALNSVPPRASVLTTEHLFPQLSNRPNAFVVATNRHLPGNESLSQDLDNWANQSQFIAIDYPMDPQNALILQNDTELSGFGVYVEEGGAVIYERGWTGRPAIFEPWNETVAGSYFRGHSTSTSSKYATSLGPTLYHAPGGASGETLWSGPQFVTLPLGTYTVTFNLEVASPSTGRQLALFVKDSAVAVVDKPLLTLGGYTYYKATVHPASTSLKLVAEQNVTASQADNAFTRTQVKLTFELSQPSYVEFPAIEVSTSMSVYLVSTSVLQTAAST